MLETNPFQSFEGAKVYHESLSFCVGPILFTSSEISTISGAKLSLTGGEHCCLDLFHWLDMQENEGIRDLVLGRILYVQRENVENRWNSVLCGTTKTLSGGYWLF